MCQLSASLSNQEWPRLTSPRRSPSSRLAGARAVKWRARWQLALLALLTLSLAVPAAAASDANGDDPQVEAAIQEGIALRRAGNDEAALSLFLDLEHNNPDSIRVLL